MGPKENVYSVLLVSAAEKFNSSRRSPKRNTTR